MATIGLKKLFAMASGSSRGGGESYPGDHRSAGNKGRITRVKGGGGGRSSTKTRGKSTPKGKGKK